MYKLSKRSFRESLQFLSLIFFPFKNRPERIYNLFNEKNNLGTKFSYINVGLWENAKSYDEACQSLAKMLMEKLNVGHEDKVLDIGPGLGDQDFYWLQNFPLTKIWALNLSKSQIKLASQRAKEFLLEERCEFIYGDAVHLPFSDNSFDKIICLEAAFHFNTREKFMKEAFRVLRPGGVMAVADVIPMDFPKNWPFLTKFYYWWGCSIWQTPTKNLYPIKKYKELFENSGFIVQELQSIREKTSIPFKKYAQEHSDDPHLVGKVHPWIRKLWKMDSGDLQKHQKLGMDYVIGVFQKPELLQ